MKWTLGSTLWDDLLWTCADEAGNQIGEAVHVQGGGWLAIYTNPVRYHGTFDLLRDAQARVQAAHADRQAALRHEAVRAERTAAIRRARGGY